MKKRFLDDLDKRSLGQLVTELDRTLDVPHVYLVSDRHSHEPHGEGLVRDVDGHGRQVIVERELAAAWAQCGLPLGAEPHARMLFDRVEIVVGGLALFALGGVLGILLGAGWLCRP